MISAQARRRTIAAAALVLAAFLAAGGMQSASRASEAVEPPRAADAAVATLGDVEILLNAYRYFLRQARSDVVSLMSTTSGAAPGELSRAAIRGATAADVVKQRALASAVTYYSLFARAVELGVVDRDDDPFHTDNMSRLKINRTIYGPRILSDSIVISRFVDDVLEPGIKAALRLDESITDDDIRRHYDEHPEIGRPRLSIAVRKIYVSYTPASRRSVGRRMAAIRAEIERGGDFESLARLHSQTIKESPWTQHDHEGRQIITRRGVEDAFLRERFFDMGEGEVSPVVDSGSGFYILKCERVNELRVSVERARTLIIRDLVDRAMRDVVRASRQQYELRVNHDVYDRVAVS